MTLTSKEFTEPRMYSLAEVAEIMSLSKETIHRAFSAGKLKGCRFGRAIRITAEDLNNYIEDARVRSGS